MSIEIRTIAIGSAAFAASLAALAQTVPAPPAPASAYNSAFEGYRPFSAGEVGDWRKANDTVREIGGWRAYAREIQLGAKEQPAQAPQGSASQPPAAHPHQGHGK